MNLQKVLLASPTDHLWKRVGIYPHHGVIIFLPALHSKNSAGIGEFFDLFPLIDWCHRLKMDVLQLLPLNDCGNDPSPYNSLSSCAINFLLLSLHALPFLEELPSLKEQLTQLHLLNQTKRIAYERVTQQKTEWLKNYFNQVGARIQSSEKFLAFVNKNPWLKPYALFRALKEHFQNTPHASWDLQQKNYTQLLQMHSSSIAFYMTMQFLCYTQLRELRKYAHSKGVKLKGDIPILVGVESSDVWQYPSYFSTQYVAGAPPDMYYDQGQSWGFPLFEWDALRQDHYRWWKQRLKYASAFYDLFRIDHVIGFFHIWAIPKGHPAKNGHYIPDDPAQTQAQGRELLNMILSFSEDMMPIAEDLGTFPEYLPSVLKEMGICGTRVMRWERYWKKEGQPFIPITHYSPLSLTCVSTHDSETLAQWWQIYPKEAQELAHSKKWEYSPELCFSKRREILWDSHHTTSLFHINLLQEYLALFPELIHSIPEEERINIPGVMLPSNWTYRYRCPVEEIISHEGLIEQMNQILFSPGVP